MFRCIPALQIIYRQIESSFEALPSAGKFYSYNLAGMQLIYTISDYCYFYVFVDILGCEEKTGINKKFAPIYLT